MLEQLKEMVYRSNQELVRKGVVLYTWGNASGIDRESGYMVIKPSGVAYETMKASDMVVVDTMTGQIIEGDYRPSSDTKTHIELYRAFPQIGGVVHTHSVYAVAYAQAGMDVEALGTTHADYFYGAVPCTRQLTQEEVQTDYETNTGKVIVETFAKRGLDYKSIPAALVRSHGPFAWGNTVEDAVYHAVVLETICQMNLMSQSLNSHCQMPKYILEKHYERKHGVNAYYGQKERI